MAQWRQWRHAAFCCYHSTTMATRLLVLSLATTANACTVAMAGGGATADGSTMLLHTDDCLNCDFRIARVAPVPANTPTRVLRFRETFPREVSTRSPTYAPENLGAFPPALLDTWRSSTWLSNATLGVLSTIDPAVLAAVGAGSPDGDTYGTIEGLYSIANTEQVAIAETTSAALALLWQPSRQPLGTRFDGALWDISALSKAALARCPTAKCAIERVDGDRTGP